MDSRELSEVEQGLPEKAFLRTVEAPFFRRTGQVSADVVHFDIPEFTCLCPMTGQPDFARVGIWYIPDKKIVESKSLKLYMHSFRNIGIFHETAVRVMREDLDELLNPLWVLVSGRFNRRGGIASVVNSTSKRLEVQLNSLEELIVKNLIS